MSLYDMLRDRELARARFPVAVVGAGFVGSSLVQRLEDAPGLTPVLVVARDTGRGLAALQAAGVEAGEVVVAESAREAEAGIAAGKRVVTGAVECVSEVAGIQLVVDVTGDIDLGVEMGLAVLRAGRDLVTFNYEADATVGTALDKAARKAGAIYSGADGDQPAVLARLVEEVRLMGLQVVVALNCKGFLDRHATPVSTAGWSARQGTSPRMTTAFTDGTKMNVENASLANAAGLRPVRRGMMGLESTLERVLADCESAFPDALDAVDYTLGGDFRGGVAVAAKAPAGTDTGHLSYYKLGDGPFYLFFRPYHVVEFEAVRGIAGVLLRREASIRPRSAMVDVVTIAKRGLCRGERLDGIGGETAYGEIASRPGSREFVPVGLAHHARCLRAVAADEPLRLEEAELADVPLVRVWSENRMD